MKKIYSLLVFTFFTAIVFGQISITATGTPFSQDFNTLATTGTTNALSTLPLGWVFLETGTNANTTYAADNGGNASGNTFSYGTGTNTDRALGGLLSGNLNPTIGASFTNNTGSLITELAISYTGEQWRLGATGRVDRLDFSYSTNATSLATGTYTAATLLNFIAPLTSGALGAFDGNATGNRTAISSTITGLNIANGATFWIKWSDFNASGNDDGLSIDDFSITATGGVDVLPPTITTLTPVNAATNVAINTNLIILFNEPIVKGTGNILIKKVSDNSTVQTIDVSTATPVTVSGSTATIAISTLLNNTAYYIEIPNTAFTDVATNAFAGFSGSSTWSFTTIPVAAPPAAGIINNNYSFTNCATTFLAEGWSQFSITGTQTWACTTPGRTAAPDNGIQMNAFVSSGNNPLNEDWLISPVFDLSAVSAPTLKFYSKGDFTGNSLQLKISSNYVAGTNPNTATWINLAGNFPANVAAQGTWTLSDNIDLSAFNTAGITIAWVYINPLTTNSSRWTIDDVTIYPQVVLQPCIEPIDQPTNLILTPTAVSVAGTFTEIPAPTTVQNYLVVRSLTTPLTQLPVDATSYTTGQVIGGGNGTVVGTTSDGTFTDNTIVPSTQYYYFVFAMEDQSCTAGPNYNQLTPLTATVNTPALAGCITPNAPTALTLMPANTTISGSFIGSAASKYLVVISTNIGPLGATPIDGTSYTVGQAFGNGSIVSIGASTTFVASGLTVSTPYYFYVFALNEVCAGTPFYSTTSLNGTSTTTNNATGIPVGYYNTAVGLTCQSLKTAVKNIITAGANDITYGGLWSLYQYSDLRRNDANTATIVWDMYSDNPTGSEPYVFSYGPPPSPNPTNIRGQCGTYSGEGDCYNREHSTPQSWFGSLNPMVSDAHHIFPTDGKVNAVRSNFPYGEVNNATTTSLNGSKLGTGNNFGYTATVFEPINAYKGDFARAGLYMITRYEDEVISQNWSSKGTGNTVFLSTTDEPDVAKRKLQMYDAYYLKTLIKWHNQDPVSQKEIDRNNAIYYTTIGSNPQANRNPFVDHPEYVAAMFQCTGLLPVTLLDFTVQKNKETVLLKWYATYEAQFNKYEIERSTDGRTFNKIAEVVGRNLSNYDFTDIDLPRATVVYYRLKMIDQDGKFENSKIVAIKLNNNLSNALVYPNPSIDYLNIKLYQVLQVNSTLQVMDVTGRILKEQIINANTININLDVKCLAAGRYFVKIINNTQIINESFVVTK
jgi:endonuclease I